MPWYIQIDAIFFHLQKLLPSLSLITETQIWSEVKRLMSTNRCLLRFISKQACTYIHRKLKIKRFITAISRGRCFLCLLFVHRCLFTTMFQINDTFKWSCLMHGFFFSGRSVVHCKCYGWECLERQHCNHQMPHSQFCERLRLCHFLAAGRKKWNSSAG